MSDELLCAAHMQIPKSGIFKYLFLWRVTLDWQEDQALLVHLELVSQDLRYAWFLFGEREAG